MLPLADSLSYINIISSIPPFSYVLLSLNLIPPSSYVPLYLNDVKAELSILHSSGFLCTSLFEYELEEFLLSLKLKP